MVIKLGRVLPTLFVLSIAPAAADDSALPQEPDGDLTHILNNMTIVAERGLSQSDRLPFVLRIILAPTPDSGSECDGTPESCPREYAYLAVSDFGEAPDQKLFRLPAAYGWEFDSWIELPKSADEKAFFVFRMKRSVVAADISKGWFAEEVYEVAVNPYTGFMKKID